MQKCVFSSFARALYVLVRENIFPVRCSCHSCASRVRSVPHPKPGPRVTPPIEKPGGDIAKTVAIISKVLSSCLGYEGIHFGRTFYPIIP